MDWTIDDHNISWLSLPPYRAQVFKTGIHWTHRIECQSCGFKSLGGPLMATRKAAREAAEELIQRDARDSDPCPALTVEAPTP